ncbi:hypothetical protein CI109_107175 [Kwoniella shandongensis]|uniref:Uncharacterized protein n=1 Tax=Kwoniella shandongensis TaxID=1734106 RepID=A0A5M6C1X2_9TREE|nr:uncharacterized protein CI109_002458 [Kwoniella shandongensis]KAA5529117.1 hypothetical protein CI109_002458 [Kwoniella shandongensis]
MYSDPWADAPSTPKLSSNPGSPNVGSPSPSRVRHVTSSPSDVVGRSSLELEVISSPITIDEPAPVGEAVQQPIEEDEEDIAVKAESGVVEESGQIPLDDEAAVAETEEDGFDDFDDFDDPASAPISGADGGPSTAGQSDDGVAAAGGAGDDGFGDFGDFEEGDFEEPQGAGVVEEEVVQHEPAQQRWHALSLRPLPPRSEMLEQLSSLLTPILSSAESSEQLTDEPTRLVGGLSQVLVGESSRDAYAQLTTAPMLKPLDWTRSKVRRDHLISMGVPVNLDEVDSHRLSALPPLRITTSRSMLPPPRPQSANADPNANGRYTTQQKGKGRDTSPMSVPNSAGGFRPNGPAGTGKYGLGEKPEMDVSRAEELCGLQEDQLSILSIHALKKIQDELVTITAQASAPLAWSLQLKDAQVQDSTTYNGMISELISNAAKVKSAQTHASSGGVFRRASTKARPQSVSGTVTPRRTGSPGMW